MCPVSSVVERHVYTVGGGGSNPSLGTIYNAGLAERSKASVFQTDVRENRGFESHNPLQAALVQSAEYLLGKEGVAGSIPASSSISCRCSSSSRALRS